MPIVSCEVGGTSHLNGKGHVRADFDSAPGAHCPGWLLRAARLFIISAVPLLCCAPLPELMNELRENIKLRAAGYIRYTAERY